MRHDQSPPGRSHCIRVAPLGPAASTVVLPASIEILGYPDPIASDAAQLIAAAYANVDQSITAELGHAQAVREAARKV